MPARDTSDVWRRGHRTRRHDREMLFFIVVLLLLRLCAAVCVFLSFPTSDRQSTFLPSVSFCRLMSESYFSFLFFLYTSSTQTQIGRRSTLCARRALREKVSQVAALPRGRRAWRQRSLLLPLVLRSRSRRRRRQGRQDAAGTRGPCLEKVGTRGHGGAGRGEEPAMVHPHFHGSRRAGDPSSP